MSTCTLKHILAAAPDENNPWAGVYKIPWYDEAFSARMLREHLTQDHDLASRKQETITAQCRWLNDRFRTDESLRILDLCCGPGLYAQNLTAPRDRYTGMDFGPASIDHAIKHYGSSHHTFKLDDVASAPFGGPYDLILMIYGEFNVFPPETCRAILHRVWRALAPGGTLAVEPHRFDAVKSLGQAPQSWQTAESGLFSQRPHICLTQSHWLESLHVAQTLFHVIDAESGNVEEYRNTMQAWTNEEYRALMEDAGFTSVTLHEDWPCHNDYHLLISGRKE
ncbi:class I SAM-dependent methyltransferase [Salidesulfovibrio brasiliensis]|uniref:class I SAM-dependent methyltransferase n=1 Tax=Salidesulfovibrio brasiliensis TaxID=221711 RepID=UPI0006CF31DA|nr:class I SAM-dependent methyltransferase [Salidesulfovibrio brasiliensis]